MFTGGSLVTIGGWLNLTLTLFGLFNIMGYYTELNLNVDFINPPADFIQVLKWMINDPPHDPYTSPPFELPKHPLFGDTRWKFMLQCSACWPGAIFSHLEENSWVEHQVEWQFSVRCHVKNYADEIKLFLDWIWPHLYKGHMMLGYFQDEDKNFPTLIMCDEEKLLIQTVPNEYD